MLVYRLKNIAHFNDMICYWDACAKRDGFAGIYIISMNTWRDQAAKSRWVRGTVDFEPNKTRMEMTHVSEWMKPRETESLLWNRFAIRSIDYKELNEKMLKIPHKKNQFRAVGFDYKRFYS